MVNPDLKFIDSYDDPKLLSYNNYIHNAIKYLYFLHINLCDIFQISQINEFFLDRVFLSLLKIYSIINYCDFLYFYTISNIYILFQNTKAPHSYS